MALAWLLLFFFCKLSNAHPQGVPENQEKVSDEFHIVHQWHTVNFTWPSHRHYHSALHNKMYIAENVFVSNVKIYNDTMYLALPRLKLGVPTTLGQVPLESETRTDILVAPFPNWKQNALGNCAGFQSVHSFEIDLDGVMWVIDNGKPSVIIPKNRNGRICLPSLVLIDLKNDSNILVRYIFPEEIVGADSYLKDIVVDDVDGGYAYITDNSKRNPGIVVYSRNDNLAWKFTDPRSMKADVETRYEGNVDISGNINGIALGTRYLKSDGVIERYVFFSSLFSYTLYACHASWLRNKSISEKFPMMTTNVILVGTKSSFSDGMIMDAKGYLYFGLLQEHSIARWDSKNVSVLTDHIIADNAIFTWIERFGFDEANNLYVLVTKFSRYAKEKINPSKVNYKILRVNVGANSYLQMGENFTDAEQADEPGVAVDLSSFKAMWIILMCLMFVVRPMED